MPASNSNSSHSVQQNSSMGGPLKNEESVRGDDKTDNFFHINETELTLTRFYTTEEVGSTTFQGKTLQQTVDSLAYTLLLPEYVAQETALIINALEPGHQYNSVAAPIGVPEPRPELLITKGMRVETAVAVENKLATELVVFDNTAVAYESSRKQFLLWRRWNDVHPNPRLFGTERLKSSYGEEPGKIDTNTANSLANERGEDKIDDDAVIIVQRLGDKIKNETNGDRIPIIATTSIQNLRPLPLLATGGATIHQPFVPTFQPSIMDDHFFLLGLAAAVANDSGVLKKAFASTEHLNKGLLTVRLFMEARVELPQLRGGENDKNGRVLKGAAKRRQNRSLNTTTKSFNNSFGETNSTVGVKGTDRSVSATPSVLVTLPIYLTLDTLLPVSKATDSTISPSHLDLALGRTYDAVDEFYVALLEKAFAALKGSYSALHGGSAVEVLKALLPGDEGRYIRWNDALFNKPEVMDALRRVTGGGKARSIGPAVDADKIEIDAASTKLTTSHDEGGSAQSPDIGMAATETERKFVSADGTAVSLSPIAGSMPSTKRVSISTAAAAPFPFSANGNSSQTLASSIKRSVASASSDRGGLPIDADVGPGEQFDADEDFKAAADAASSIASARKNAEELWWALQEATVACQPMLLTNTNLCESGSLGTSSYGSIPSPITDNSLHLESWNKFNWSYGVVVLAAVELDTANNGCSPYLKAIRKRSKRTQGEIRRLVKVRSVFRSNHPDYAKLRGEWSLPDGGGRTFASEMYDYNSDIAAGEKDIISELQKNNTDEQANIKVSGGNPNWTAFAQSYLQYNVADAIEKKSEDVVWWMTIDEVCRHFNCFFTLFNTSGGSTAGSAFTPPRALIDSVMMATRIEEAERRKPSDPFQTRRNEENNLSTNETSSKKGKNAIISVNDLAHSEPFFETPMSALLQLLKRSAVIGDATTTSDTLTRIAQIRPSPSLSSAPSHFPHFLLVVRKEEDSLGNASNIDVPDGTDIRFKSIYDVKPNELDLGDETDDEKISRGMGGTMTSRTGSAVDIAVTPMNSLQLEIKVSVPKPLACRKDICIQLYRVTGPFKQSCVKTVRPDGKEGNVLAFPLHTKVPVKTLGTQFVSTSLLYSGACNVSTSDTASMSSHVSSSAWSSVSSTSGGSLDGTRGSGNSFSRSFSFECDVNSGFYNIVVAPDSETTANSNMYFPESSLITVSVVKRLNGENFGVELSLLE